MSLIDWLLVGGIVAVAIAVIAIPERSRTKLRYVAVALAALAVLQLALQGVYWGAPAAWAFILWLNALLWAPQLVNLWTRWLTAGLGLVVLGPWMLAPPLPDLAKPQGQHAVGTHIYRWVDTTRPETLTADAEDRRNVIAQVWYPAAESQDARLPYIDGLGRLPNHVSLIPNFMMAGYGRAETHARADAPPAGDETTPLMLFSPGYGAPRAFYTGLATDLASRGFIVITVDHPYEVAVTELADGSIATPRHDVPSDGDGDTAMASELDVRVADLRFVLDQIDKGALGPELTQHIDHARIYAAGHSFGGAAAAVLLAKDARVAKAANIDGTPYGALPVLERPFLLLESDKRSAHGDRYLTRNAEILANSRAPAWRYEIRNASHFSFTDAPLFFAPPGRFALTSLVGGSHGTARTQRDAADILAAFFGEDAERDLAALKLKDVTGGPSSSAFNTSGKSP